MDLRIGFSSCPNDVFIFAALVEGQIPGSGRYRAVIDDVEALNSRARRRDLDATKISFHAFGHLRDSHVLLDAGAALGRGCGPLVVARTPLTRDALSRCRIAIPGALTTAALLFRLWAPEAADFEVLVFDRIIDAVAAGRADAGLIIHESRFTYAGRGLVEVVDLGKWWESESGLPIPLGGIIADRRLGLDAIRRFNAELRESIRFARAFPERVWPLIRRHAQELDDEVIRAHIDLYVTGFTDQLGDEGRRAIAALFDRAEDAGILPRRRGAFEDAFLR
jgi:1,4-dihydroxy-6-naphthoate synthase